MYILIIYLDIYVYIKVYTIVYNKYISEYILYAFLVSSGKSPTHLNAQKRTIFFEMLQISAAPLNADDRGCFMTISRRGEDETARKIR